MKKKTPTEKKKKSKSKKTDSGRNTPVMDGGSSPAHSKDDGEKAEKKSEKKPEKKSEKKSDKKSSKKSSISVPKEFQPCK